MHFACHLRWIFDLLQSLYFRLLLCTYSGFNHHSFVCHFVVAGKPVSWMMVAPSVTPKKQNVGANNPAMRLYKFETDTGQVS